VPQPVVEPLPLMADRILRWRQVDEDVVSLDLDREAAQVVGPLVERAAAAEVEARVVPVARDDPVLHRPAVQREPHVRAAVVDRVHLAAFGDQAHRVSVEGDDQPPRRLDLGNRGRAHATRGLDRHESTLRPS
jgi:predicted component of type VI protein secretion system